ncbi:hypothetical protein DCAR_0727163 [Daucus carota subsp. sativus]|uniref:Methionine aminopeptidase n=1 Tax=Daucus carota subsp. sativus TaxID=79200 RepID=A0AAF1B682_DAUCS|nr:PREDICTED: methionine aminopeptidase 1B, chloroplastic-like [Daucus carota subsp. sativus]WOH07730.1 hypothetical protein DCAR_0727163 [Daucus carota subsp. sativus]
MAAATPAISSAPRVPLQHCSSFLHGIALPSSSSTLCPPSRSYIQPSKRFFVFWKRMEEAIRIKRERERNKLLAASTKRLPLKRGKVSPRLPVPDHIQKPPYTSSNFLPETSREYQIHDAEGLFKMRAACKLAAQVLDYAGTLVRPSVTTNEIDEAVHQMIIEAGAYPSPLGYGSFPKSVCTSVNECMCHGIPDSRKLEDGDIINIDVTVYLDGYHGDTSKTFLCGNVDDVTKKLVKVTEECLQIGISVCKEGAPFRNIGNSISEHAEKFGYGVVDRFVGHGVGTVFHSEPFIYHDRNRKPGTMVEGMTFTIEPILTLGSIECITWADNWTTLTADGSPAAQFEHSILITKSGAEILTQT